MDRRSSDSSKSPKVDSKGKGTKSSKGNGRGNGRGKRKRSRANGAGIPGTAIKRVAKRNGATRVGGDFIEAGYKVLTGFVDTIISHAVVYADHTRRKTIMDGDISLSLKRHNVDSPVLMDLNRLAIPKASFQRLVRRVAKQDTMRFQLKGLMRLQFAAERYCDALFAGAVSSAKHAGRKTVRKKDLVLATGMHCPLQ
jgi:histone H3/H4